MFECDSQIQKEEQKNYLHNMAKLNDLNTQYYWKDKDGKWDAFDDTDCILINKQHPFMKEIPLVSKVGFKITVEINQKLTLKNPQNEEFEVKKCQDRNRNARKRPAGSR